MKLRYRLLTFLLLFGFIGIINSPSHAQIGDVGNILQSSTEDANTLARAYLEPFGSGFGASLNTGWTNTASPHSTLGFDLTVSSGLAIVPDDAKSFNVTELGLQLDHESGPEISQTINGSQESGSTLAAYTDQDFDGDGQPEKLFEFTMPEGSGFGYVPAPMIKGAVGIVKDTEIMFRYMPEYDVGDFGSFSLYGFGAKHGINQWLPGGNLLPVNLSVMFGYTSMEVGSGLDITADDVMGDNESDIENPYSASQWDGQEIGLNTDAWTINALVGKSLPVISVYAGVGYEASTLNINTPGSYPTIDVKENPTPDEPFIVEELDEPLDISIEGDNGMRALAGFRFRFAVLHISGSYTLSNYSSYNLGVGISFR